MCTMEPDLNEKRSSSYKSLIFISQWWWKSEVGENISYFLLASLSEAFLMNYWLLKFIAKLHSKLFTSSLICIYFLTKHILSNSAGSIILSNIKRCHSCKCFNSVFLQKTKIMYICLWVIGVKLRVYHMLVLELTFLPLCILRQWSNGGNLRWTTLIPFFSLRYCANYMIVL